MANNLNGAGGSTSYSANGSGGAGGAAYPHISDLLNRARRDLQPLQQAPIKRLLDRASDAARTAQTLYDFGKPVQAYYEYLVAVQAVSETIPAHKDLPSIREHRSLDAQYKDTTRKIFSLQNQFDAVKATILADNERWQTAPSTASEYSPAQSGSTRPQSTMNGYDSDSGYRSASFASRVNGQHTPANNAPTDDLTNRFAKLRTSAAPSSPTITSYRQAESPMGSPKRRDRPYSQGYPPPRSVQTLHGPPYPGAMNVDTRVPRVLPKPPSPAYSPSRGGPPTPSARSSIIGPVAERPPSVGSTHSFSYQQRAEDAYGSNYASSINSSEGQATGRRRRRNPEADRSETEISAERLYDYLRSYNVLMIDVRGRDDYDTGHIFCRSPMCIEPTALRPNMSADELQDALVLSPEEEQIYFARRSDFDLVVYYDQSTDSASFLDGYTATIKPQLRYLHEALTHYNEEKPLHWPPLLLAGGLDSWVDLLGPQSLQTSNTAARRVKAIPRKALNNDAAKLSLPRRRHRDFDPLDAEEEQKWRERARSESVKVPLPAAPEDEDDPRFAAQSEDDFANRYPDVASVEERTLVSRVPRRAPPEPPSIPSYPTPPVLSAPSRPPPVMSRPSYSGVSERNVTPAVPAKVLELAPYIPPRLTRLPRMGLFNFGATCYMNATIQCLSATLPLTAFFLEGKWKKHIQKDNWKGSRGIMSTLYNTLLENLWLSGDVSILRPTNFRKFCSRLNREWGYDRQQDAKEFLEFLVDALHEDLNDNWSRNPLKELSAQEEATRERMAPFSAAQHEWARYEHRDLSELTQLFGGQHISKLQCTTCRNTSTTYEAFYSISVEIPHITSRRVTIDDCLESYCSAERLSGDEVWRCPHCKAEREAIKRITISRAPEFLVIHFKRFAAGHSERAQKIHTEIDFPLDSFDFTKYMLPSPSRQERDALAARSHSLDPNPRSMTPPFRYNAYAVMRHIGATMTSGHYIASVKDVARGTWREFNDDRVTDFQPAAMSPARRLQNREAYIVFYQREAPTMKP